MRDPREALAAMRADSIPAGQVGLWTVSKAAPSAQVAALHEVPMRRYTWLHRLTDETLNKPPGELVMVDHPNELRTHLEPIRHARGRVLVGGLGLGCVARGLLASERVTGVVVVERDWDVLDLVEPYMPRDPRLELVADDCEAFLQRTSAEFDVAWFDLWSDPDRGESHLAVTHQRLLHAARRRVRWSGAWAFPRWARTANRRSGIIQG